MGLTVTIDFGILDYLGIFIKKELGSRDCASSWAKSFQDK